MGPELSLLIGALAGGTGALLSYWAGWRAMGDVMRIRGGVIGRPQLIFNEGSTQRGNGNGGPTTSKPQPAGGRLIGADGVPIGYRPKPQPSGGRNPFVSEFQQHINDALVLYGYQPRPQQGTPNPPPREP